MCEITLNEQHKNAIQYPVVNDLNYVVYSI